MSAKTDPSQSPLSPHCEEICQRGLFDNVRVSTERRRRIQDEICKRLNIRRPKGNATLGALIDAIYHGKVVLRRRDDPQEREFYVGMPLRKAETPGPTNEPKPDPRCPRDWDD